MEVRGWGDSRKWVTGKSTLVASRSWRHKEELFPRVFGEHGPAATMTSARDIISDF